MTNETKYTEGPWVQFSDKGRVTAIMPAMRSGDVATFSEPFPSDADARLICAAPALLKALQWFADPDNWREEQVSEGYIFSAEWRVGVSPIEIAKAAIAKATAA